MTPAGRETWVFVLRRASAAEGWTPDRLWTAWDVSQEARADGCNAVRSVKQGQRLGMSQRSVERHRRELVRDGWLTVQRRGGNGKGATMYRLTLPGRWASHAAEAAGHLAVLAADQQSDPPRSGEGVAADSITNLAQSHPPLTSAPVAGDSMSSPPVTRQSPATPERERGGALMPLDPAAASPASDFTAAWLAERTGVDPVACLVAIEQLESEQQQRGAPVRSRRAFVTRCWELDQHDMRRRVALIKAGGHSASPRTAMACDNRSPHGRHDWADKHGRQTLWCPGVSP